MRRIALLGAALAIAACATQSDPAPPPAAPRPLVDSTEIPGAFLLRQHLRFSWQGGATDADAVVQSACGELVVAILDPLQRPALVIRQRGMQVETQSRAPVPLPFPPEYVLLDVQRTYFVPLEPAPPADGRRDVSWRGVAIAETWRGGRLFERRFGSPPETTLVRYAAGLVPGERPDAAVVENEGRGYRIEVSTYSYQDVACPPRAARSRAGSIGRADSIEEGSP